MLRRCQFIFIVLVILHESEIVSGRFFQEQKEPNYLYVLNRNEPLTAKSRPKRFIPWHKETVTGKGSSELGEENIKGAEFILENDANNIAFVFWKHHETNVIFILTCQDANTTSLGKLSNKGCHSYSNFYRSGDLGASFNRSDQVAPFENHWLHSIYLSSVNKAFIVITDYFNKTLFVTENKGVDYEKFKLNFSPTFIEFHPTNKDVLAAFDNTKEGKQSLWLSRNRGKTWQFISKNVKNYFWQTEKLSDTSNGIYFERLEIHRSKYEGEMVSSLCHYPFPKVQDSVQPVLIKITDLVQNSVFIGDEYVIVQMAANKHLFSMRPKYNPYFRKVIYKFQNSKPHLHHTVLSSDNNEIILAVFNPDKTVTLYLSDETGSYFFFIQENVIAEALTDAGKIPKIDFYRAKGFISSYLVNRKDNGTLISHDKGYSWNPLTYEKKGHDGRDVDIDCKRVGGECRLNLFIRVEEFYSDYTAPLLSKESAPGIILAQGRIGGVLKHEDLVHAKHDVYISIDAGKTWRQTLGSFYSYAILDHGNAIAATPLQFTVRQEIKLSTNFGYHWYDFFLTRRYSRIAAIITDSTAKTLVVNVFGFLYQQPKHSDVKGNQWVVWQFNFTKLLSRACKDEDYYRYYPHSKEACLLGQKYSYLQNLRHENASATCFSPPGFDLKLRRDACPCTKHDYECDDNYVTVPIGKYSYTCKPINDHQKQQQNCDLNGFYIKTKGYRKQHGNKCTKGVEQELSGTKEKCNVVLPVVKIKSSLIAVGLEEIVTFKIQYSINTYGSNYTWDFGDGTVISGEMSQVETVQHYFKTIGHFAVKLIAMNSKGTYTDTALIVVLDKTYHSAFIDFDAPIIVNQENKFILRKLQKDGESKKEIPDGKSIRFLWSFKGVYIGGTHFSSVPYTFSESGVFQVEVQIISPVNSQTVYRMVRVYEKAYVIDITFSSYLDTLNTQTQTWTNDFIDKFTNFITIRYNIDSNSDRVIVQVNNTIPTCARLIICDVESNLVTYKCAEQLVKEITNDINLKKPLLDAYHNAHIHIQTAKMVGPVRHMISDAGSTAASSHNYIWIYVVVLLLIIVIIIGAAILYRHRGKKSWFNVRRNKHDIMQKNLVFHTDEDCVGLEGPDLPQYRD